MDVYYLNECGIIRKAEYVSEFKFTPNCSLVLTKELHKRYFHGSYDQERLGEYSILYIFKIIDTFSGEVLKTFESKESNISDLVIKIAKETEKEHLLNLDVNYIYRDTMRKLFMQKLEEYIEKQWKANSTK